MKYFLNIFLILYLVCKPVIPMLEYALDYDHIKNTLCINKSRPELHCNGKCYLGKELAKSGQQDTSKIKDQTQKIIDFYIPVDISEVMALVQDVFPDHTFVYERDYFHLFLKHIFRPPIF